MTELWIERGEGGGLEAEERIGSRGGEKLKGESNRRGGDGEDKVKSEEVGRG